MSKTCIGDLVIDFDHIINDEDDNAEYITIWKNGSPMWCDIYCDINGYFIDLNFKKHYIPKDSI